MKKLLVLAVVMLMTSSAFAVVDPDPNMMGLFTDTTADTWFLDGVAPFSQTNVYAILTNPTFDYLYGFEFQVSFGGTAAATVLSTTFDNPQALNVGSGTNYIVGFGSPSPCTEATLMLTMNVMFMDATGAGDVFITLGPSEPSSNELGLPTMLLADGVLTPVGYSTGPADTGSRVEVVSCALVGVGSSTTMGDVGVVATEPATFDSVKSLYR